MFLSIGRVANRLPVSRCGVRFLDRLTHPLTAVIVTKLVEASRETVIPAREPESRRVACTRLLIPAAGMTGGKAVGDSKNSYLVSSFA